MEGSNNNKTEGGLTKEQEQSIMDLLNKSSKKKQNSLTSEQEKSIMDLLNKNKQTNSKNEGLTDEQSKSILDLLNKSKEKNNEKEPTKDENEALMDSIISKNGKENTNKPSLENKKNIKDSKNYDEVEKPIGSQKYEDEAKVEDIKEKKVFKAGVIDLSNLAKAQAKDVADSRMTESKEDRSKNWITRTAKRFWKHNVAQEWYRNREIERVRKEILESGNLYAGETKTTTVKDYENAKKAIVERFTSEYDEMLKEKEKDSKELISDEKTKGDIKELIKQFAGDPTMSEAAFTEEQNRILSTSNPDYAKAGKMYASNLLDIAREIRNSISHGEKLAEMDFDVEITLGQAQESLNTEAKHNSFEKLIEKTQTSKLGKYLFNEPAGVAIAAGLYSAGSFLGMKVLRSKLMKIGTFGATAILAGGISASKEAARLNRERAQHIRENTKGMFREEEMMERKQVSKEMAKENKFNNTDMKRRKEMEENRYETKNASEIIQNFEKDLEKISSGKVTIDELNLVLVNLSDLEARIKFGDTEQVDLVAYSRFNKVEEERMKLDNYRAKVKVLIRKGIEDGRIDFDKSNGDFDNYLKQLIETQTEGLTSDFEEKNKIFKEMKRKKVAWAFAKTALIGASAGVVFQEVRSLFQSETDGIIEGAIKHLKGDQEHMATKATAFEGLRRWFTHDSPRLPFGTGHEMILGNTHMQLPDGVTMSHNADGTYDVLNGGKVISEHIKIDFNANGDLSDASKELLSKDNIYSSFAQTGGKITDHVTRTAQEYTNKHPELTTKVDREFMGNNTPMHPDPDHPGHLLGADQNELRTHWGGVGGNGIDQHGNYVLNVQHMTNDGSYQDGYPPVMANDEMKKGGLTLLLSVTKGLQHTVFKVPIDANGNAIIDPKSTIGQMMFQNVNGKAVFTGQFAEIAHPNGIAKDGDQIMQILGTHIGTGRPGEVIEDIIKDTTTPNVKLNVPADWDWNPLFIPGLARRPLERGEYNEEKGEDLDPIPVPYPYYYGSGLDRGKWQEDFSPRLKNNPEAKLDPKEEINWYFKDQKRRNPGYVEKELSKLESQNPEPLGKKVEVIVCVAAAGHQEHDNIYKTLETYRTQKDKKGNSIWQGDDNKFEIFLYINWPKGKDPQKTLDEIKRFKEDHPEVKVRVYEEEITNGKMELGWYKKKIFDLALKKHEERNSKEDIVIITNDADMTSTSPTYLENALSILNNPKNKNTDAVLGRFDLDPEIYRKNPTFHTIMKFWQFMESVMRSKYGLIGTQGRNTIMRGSSYAAVGGNRTKEFWADIEFGQLFDEARKKSSVAYSNASWVNVDPRREIDKFKSGEKVAYTWGGDFDTRAVRGNKISENSTPENLDIAKLATLSEDSSEVIEFKKRLQEELQEIVNLFSNITPGYISAPDNSGVNKEIYADIKMLAERAAGFLGLDISLVNNNGIFDLKITDSKKLRENLKNYREDDGYKVKIEKGRNNIENLVEKNKAHEFKWSYEQNNNRFEKRGSFEFNIGGKKVEIIIKENSYNKNKSSLSKGKKDTGITKEASSWSVVCVTEYKELKDKYPKEILYKKGERRTLATNKANEIINEGFKIKQEQEKIS